nr:hypothetical protein [Streptomyces sporangiiformans]
MSSRPQTTTHTTGEHQPYPAARDREAARTSVRTSAHTSAQCPPARYEPYLDGLFTYCLSVLCDHDAAIAAVGHALALAERRGPRGQAAPDDRRAWLYALARWMCLRKLTEAKLTKAKDKDQVEPTQQKRHGTAAEEDRRRRELALLAWPEAAGTTPEQREALELAVRHQLAAREVAAVLGMSAVAARELLGTAACEVERTRAALAVVETGTCPSVARLIGDDQLVLSSALRRELVRHVDDCPRCRRTAERAIPGSWPGTSVTPEALPVLEAPRAALHRAMAPVPRARGGGPRFDRRGFPMDPKDRAARRDRLRARAVTTTVVATVVAAPVLALWAAYRGAPLIGEGSDGRPVTASEARGPVGLGGEEAGAYESSGNTGARPDSRSTRNKRLSDVSVEVIGVASGHRKSALSVEADSSGDTTLITLTASKSSPRQVRWSAHTGASWLYLSRSSGTLRPGESLTIKVYVDHLREPIGHWSARVSIAPAGAAVSIDGYGTAGPPDPWDPGPAPGPTPSGPTPPDPTPADPGPGPQPTPSDPTPTPVDPEPTPTPSDPPPSEPGPTPMGGPASGPGGRPSPHGDGGGPSPSGS